MWTRWLLAAWITGAGFTASTAAQGLFPVPLPDPASELRVTLRGSLGWRGTPPNSPPVDAAIIPTAWKSEAGKRAIRELGLTEQSAKQALAVEAPVGEGVTLVLSLPSDTQAARDAGVRFLRGVAKEVVPGAMTKWIESANQIPLIRAEEQLQSARKEHEMTRAEAAHQRQRVRDAADMLDPSPGAVRAASAGLEQERQRIRLELVGQTARQKALQERVAALADKAATKAASDPIAAELEQIVKLREAEITRYAALEKSGQVPRDEREAAQVQLAEAKAKLLERREAAGRSAGTELLADLNKELITLSIATVENEARLEYVARRLDGLSKATEFVDALEQAQGATARAAKRLEAAETELQQARRRAENGGPFSASVSWDQPAFEQLPKGEPAKLP
jgi:hypothetical protein